MQQSAIVKTRSARFGAPCDKRRGELPIPINLRTFLNDDQLYSLRQMEGFGWHLAFVRRGPERQPEIVVSNADDSVFGTLCEDGSIDTNSRVAVRP